MVMGDYLRLCDYVLGVAVSLCVLCVYVCHHVYLCVCPYICMSVVVYMSVWLI